MKRIVAHAAARVDLAGGSLDLWPIGQIVPGACTVNVAISLSASVECTPTGRSGVELASRDLVQAYTWEPGAAAGGLPLLERLCSAYGVSGGWRIQTSSDVPPGSGLGGSSALSAALALALGAISGRTQSDAEVVAVCRDVEAANLGIPTGVQDFWPAMAGGVLCIRYLAGRDSVEPVSVALKAVAARLVVAYTGHSRVSARTNWELTRRFLDGDPDVRARMEGIAEAAQGLRQALEAGDLDACGRLVAREWELRRGLAEGLATPRMDALMEKAAKAGALGAKACGAGGGGCLAFWVAEGARLQVEEALEREGARLLPAHPVQRGHLLEVEP